RRTRRDQGIGGRPRRGPGPRGRRTGGPVRGSRRIDPRPRHLACAGRQEGGPAVSWTDPAYRDVARLLGERTGLTFPANRVEAAEMGIRRAMTRAGVGEP